MGYPAAAPVGGTVPQVANSAAARFGAALFWIAIGFWLFVGVRMISYVINVGADRTILYRTLAMVKEETVVASAVAAIAAIVLLATPKGRRGLGWVALVLAAATVAVTVWRYLP
jgi:hypothetical protein